MELTDILTQGVREPVRGYIDPLASLSFAPNLQSFLAIRDAFHDKMDVVHTMSCLAVRDSVFRTKAHHVFVAADELRDVSNELISTLQSSHGMSLFHSKLYSFFSTDLIFFSIYFILSLYIYIFFPLLFMSLFFYFFLFPIPFSLFPFSVP